MSGLPPASATVDDIPLWDLNQDGRPCPFTEDDQWFESWDELRDNADEYDNDLNVIIWWDWYPPDDDRPCDSLTLMVAMPNRERVYPWSAPVRREQEPEIREWLRQRLGRLIGYWQLDPRRAEGVGARG
ncbi:hypothetical protein [Sphaerisporangium sp. NPDC051011]|uniref:hypothetical protein n=1 Tax=Sphaerisporangium sp. NPDC051011 TaxID=3155792 RepID=UPI00340EDA29